MQDRAIPGEFVGSKTPQERWPAGRTCSFGTCSTTLSIYNASDRCSTHKRSQVFLFAPEDRRKTEGRSLKNPPRTAQNEGVEKRSVPKNGAGHPQQIRKKA